MIVVHTPRAKTKGVASASQRTVGQLRVLVSNENDATWVVPIVFPLARRVGPWTRFKARVMASLGRRKHQEVTGDLAMIEGEAATVP